MTAGLIFKTATEDINIVTAKLDVSSEQLTVLYHLLSTEETEKTERFRFERDRSNYIIARGLLRLILAEVLQVAPQKIVLETNKYGKPCLFSIEPTVHFNVSHSDEHVIYAISSICPVGVDIEEVKSLDDIEGLLQVIATSHEKNEIEKISDEDHRWEAFYRLWTRKESIIKCLGMGLSFHPKDLEVPILNNQSFIIEVSQQEQGTHTYHVSELKVFAKESISYQTSLAVQMKAKPTIRVCEFPYELIGK